jgi:hypothetical protein
MKQSKSENILKNAKAIATNVATTQNLFRQVKDETGNSISLNTNIPDRDETIADLISRLRVISQMTSTVKSQSSFSLISNSKLNTFDQKLADTANVFEQIRAILADSVSAKSIDLANLSIVDKNGTARDLRALLQQLYDRTEEVLNVNVVSFLTKKGQEHEKFLALSNDQAEFNKSLNDEFEKAQKNTQASLAATREAAGLLQETRTKSQDLSKVADQAQTDRKNIQEYFGEASTHITAIRQALQDSKSLDAEVSNNKVKFEQFQKQLDAREAQVLEGNKKLSELIAALEKEKSDITDTVSKAEKMLSLTTVAGLSSNYWQITKKLTGELLWARVAFYIGIVVLFVSAAPLFAQAVVPIIALFDPDVRDYADKMLHPGTETWQYASQTFGRIIVLVPAAWLVAFAAKRHTSLFKLREHYAYKYSLAASVEGFKKEAPKYGDEIAAMVFNELAFNPADKLETKDIEAHHPLMPFLKKALELFRKTSGEGAE